MPNVTVSGFMSAWLIYFSIRGISNNNRGPAVIQLPPAAHSRRRIHSRSNDWAEMGQLRWEANEGRQSSRSWTHLQYPLSISCWQHRPLLALASATKTEHRQKHPSR